MFGSKRAVEAGGPTTGTVVIPNLAGSTWETKVETKTSDGRTKAPTPLTPSGQLTDKCTLAKCVLSYVK